MDHRDTLHAALQLQRAAGLMSSNMTVLHQYAIALHRMSTEVPDSVFGREFLPSGAVDDTAPMPCVFRGSTQMVAMGPRRSLVGPGGPGPDTTPGRGLPKLSHVSSAAFQLVAQAGLTGLPLCTGLCWILVLKEL